MLLFKSGRSSLIAHFRNSSSALTLADWAPIVLLRLTEGFLIADGTIVELVERTAAGAGAVPPGAFTLPLAPTVVQALLPTGMLDMDWIGLTS